MIISYNNKGYQKVLLTDSRDVFYQNNPFNFLYKKNLNFLISLERSQVYQK